MLLDLNMLNLFLDLLQFPEFVNNFIFFGHDLLSLLDQISLLEIQRIVRLVPLLLAVIDVVSVIGSEVIVFRDTFDISFLHRLILLFFYVLRGVIFVDDYSVWVSMQFTTVVGALRREMSLMLLYPLILGILLSSRIGLFGRIFIQNLIIGMLCQWRRLHCVGTDLSAGAVSIHQLNRS